MISGQLSRFIYQDQKGPLLKPQNSGRCATPLIDVYIVLHKGALGVPWKGRVHEAPYTRNTTFAEIERWYKMRGANRVFVKMVDDVHMNGIDKELLKHLSKRRLAFNRNGGNDMFKDLIEPQYERRWKPNARMFYLRHVVYNMTLARTYKAYTYWREDNFFVSPLDLSDFSTADSPTSPFVVVDEYCTFGSYSDKIYVTNQLGASLLFDDSWLDFINKLVRWTIFSSKWGNIQTEAFLHDVMSTTATVERRDLHRTDVRYKNLHARCVVDTYYKCMTATMKQSLAKLGIRRC